MSGLTNTNNSVSLFYFSNNARKTGRGKIVPEENHYFNDKQYNTGI